MAIYGIRDAPRLKWQSRCDVTSLYIQSKYFLLNEMGYSGTYVPLFRAQVFIFPIHPRRKYLHYIHSYQYQTHPLIYVQFQFRDICPSIQGISFHISQKEIYTQHTPLQVTNTPTNFCTISIQGHISLNLGISFHISHKPQKEIFTQHTPLPVTNTPPNLWENLLQGHMPL